MPAEASPSLVLVDEIPPTGARLTLAEDESHYLARVCRVRAGERVSATDGRGAMASLRVVEVGGRTVAEVESCERSPALRTAWVLAGAPEGERGDWLVEKLAELGVAVFQPIDCERGDWDARNDRRERWRRLAVAALRQSRRRFLLEVRPPQAIGLALEALPAGGGAWLADPGGPSSANIRAASDGLTVGLIGPAAGLTPTERQLAEDRHFQPMALSDSRLRTETAALAWAAWWSAGGPSEIRSA